MQSEVTGLHKNQILSQRAVKYLSARQLDTQSELFRADVATWKAGTWLSFCFCAPVAYLAYFIMLLPAFTSPCLS